MMHLVIEYIYEVMHTKNFQAAYSLHNRSLF